ncbi:MAG: sulfatase [Elusimicrobiota bacterium]
MNKKVNVLHIISHDTGRMLGCYGEPVKTPNLDAVAREGVIFTNYHCAAPQCSPSRGAMFSGIMPHNNGLYGLAHRGFSLNPEVKYLPRIMAKNGYDTILFGVQHENKIVNPDVYLTEEKRLGYKRYYKGKLRYAGEIVMLVKEYLSKNPKQPFFVSVGTKETHREFPVIHKTPKDIKVPEFLVDHPDVRKDFAEFKVSLTQFDDMVGVLMKTLRDTGLDKNTMVVITTDHGIAFPGAKGMLLDPGTGIFMIIRDPKNFSGGKRINALASNIDLVPTILEYLRIPVPREVQGKNLLPVVRGDKREVHDEIFTELSYHAAYDPMRAIRTKRYKYIRSFDIRPYFFLPNSDDGLSKSVYYKKGYYSKLRPTELLFDLKTDPLERRNVAGEKKYQKVLKDLSERLVNWMERTNDPLRNGIVPLPPDAKVTPPWEYSPKKVWGEN